MSYSAEDDDENAQRKSLEKGGDQVGKRSLSSRVLDDGLLLSSNEGSIGGELSRPASDRSHKSGKSEGTMDDIDVDELLEKPLEGKELLYSFFDRRVSYSCRFSWRNPTTQ